MSISWSEMWSLHWREKRRETLSKLCIDGKLCQTHWASLSYWTQPCPVKSSAFRLQKLFWAGTVGLINKGLWGSPRAILSDVVSRAIIGDSKRSQGKRNCPEERCIRGKQTEKAKKFKIFQDRQDFIYFREKLQNWGDRTLSCIKLKITVRGTMVRSEVNNSWYFCLGS